MRAKGILIVLILAELVPYIECAASFTQPTKVPPLYEDMYVQEGSDAKLVWTYSVGSRDELDLNRAVRWNTFIPKLTTGASNRKVMILEKRDGTRQNEPTTPSYLTGRISIENPATLVIRNVTTTDDNIYECLLTTTAFVNSEVGSLIRLRVISANFVEHPKSAICPTSGGEVTFTCNATGTPHPNVTWVKDGEEIVNSSSIKIVGDGNGYSKLTVGNCENEGQLANYQCKATNLLDVKKDSKTAILFSGFKAKDADVNNNSSPSVVHGSIKEETTLRCAFRSYPPPSITWTFPDGSSTQTKLPFLVITPESNEQFGNYTCSAKGFTSRTILLTTGKGNATITNAHNNSVSWKADPRADYYVIYGTAEGEQSFCYLAIEQTNSLLLHWDSTCEVERKKKKRLVLTLEVRAQAQGKEFNYVVHRARVTLEAKARSLQGGFLAIVVPLAVGLLSAGLQ